MSPAKREKCRAKIRKELARHRYDVPCLRYAVRDGLCSLHHPEEQKKRTAVRAARWAAGDDAARQARNERARETVRAFWRWYLSYKPSTNVADVVALTQWEQEPKP